MLGCFNPKLVTSIADPLIHTHTQFCSKTTQLQYPNQRAVDVMLMQS